MANQHSVTYTKVSDLQKAYKRSTTKMYRTYTRRVPEYRWMDDIPDEEIIPSGRENLIPLDANPGYGAASIPDAGNEARTETPDLEEGSFTFNHINSRFSISLRAQALDKAARGNFIIRQIKLQSLKCIEAVMRKFGFMYYGFSTGVVAKVSGNPASGTTATVTLCDAFGQSSLDNAAYLASMFVIGEGVAFVRSNALVGIAEVTDVDDSAGTIDVEFAGGATVDLADGDQIVYANAVNAATLDETDWQKWNVGLLDINTSASLHGVATADVPSWESALWDANGGSYGFVKQKKMRQALENKGDTVLRRVILANGVETDAQARERGALLWSDSGNMNWDATVKGKGISYETSRFVPPTCAFGQGADAWGKKIITEKPDEEELIDFGRLHKAEDKSALKGGVDMIGANICRSRSRFAGYIGLNEL